MSHILSTKPKVQQSSKELLQGQSNQIPEVKITDSRPESIQQMKLSGEMENSPQVKKGAELQSFIHSSPHMITQRKRQEELFGKAIQMKENSFPGLTSNKGIQINDDPLLEQEADRMGAQALTRGSSSDIQPVSSDKNKSNSQPVAQFTREQAQKYVGPKDDVVTRVNDFRRGELERYKILLINNHDLDKGHKDYIPFEAKYFEELLEEDKDEAVAEYKKYIAGMEKNERMLEKHRKEQEPIDKKEKETLGPLTDISMGKQHIKLVGTIHGAEAEDYSSKIPKENLNNSSVILEYPPLTGTYRSDYTENDISLVNDLTQASLARYANGDGKQENINVIGGDGRKAIDRDGRHHSISIRHKQPKDFELTHPQVSKEELIGIAAPYMGVALDLEKAPMEEVIAGIFNLVKYLDGTDSILVLTNTFIRTQALAKEMEPGKREAIKAKVLEKMMQDLIKQEIYFNEMYAEAEKNDAVEAHTKKFNEARVSALHDAVCNLLLFTEVIANRKENVVVAFGNDHIGPLKELTEDLSKRK